MALRKNDTYKVEHASGEWDTIRLPRCFTAKDLATRLKCSEVWLYVPKGYHIPVLSIARVNGPVYVHYDRDQNSFDAYQVSDPASRAIPA